VKLTTHLHLVRRSRMHAAISPFPQYVIMASSLLKHGDNFTFTFIIEVHLTSYPVVSYPGGKAARA